MMFAAIKRYRKMILASIFFFYLGCGLTISLLRIDCAEALEERPKLSVPSRRISQILNRSSHSLDKVEYVVLILTSPDNEKKRDAIRMTWANFVNNIVIENGEKLYRWNQTRTGKYVEPEFIQFYYVIGTQSLSERKLELLNSEQTRNNDILFLDKIEDKYNRLTVKLLEAMKWLHGHLVNLQYVVKCDDDSFVRIDLIIKELDAFAPDIQVPQIRKDDELKNDNKFTGLYWGYFDGRAPVYLSGKWKEEDWFLCDKYLPYALGGGYVVSRSIISYIGSNADMLSQYNSEDVSMGVWTAALKGINRVHDVRFDTEYKSRGCQSDLLIRHKQEPSDMFAMYTTLVHSQGRSLCKPETVFKHPYRYKWNVPPSTCCK